MGKSSREQLLSRAYREPRYRGKQVMIIGGKIFAVGPEGRR